MRIRGRWSITSGIREGEIWSQSPDFLRHRETKNPRRHKARCGFRVLLSNVKRILAERRGFEPRLGLTLNTLSRRAT
jgi:hypothetical protein